MNEVDRIFDGDDDDDQDYIPTDKDILCHVSSRYTLYNLCACVQHTKT